MKAAGKWVALALLTALAVLFFLWNARTADIAARELPDALALRSSRGLNITFEEVERIQRQEASPCEAAALAMGSALAQREDSPEGEHVVGTARTDAGYTAIVPFEFLDGGYFRPSPVAEENHYAVISDILAVKFFMRSDAVGQVFRLNGKEYTVCGVYRADRSLVNRFASDGRDIVYLPYNDGTEIPAPQVLFLKGGEGMLTETVKEWVVSFTGRLPGEESLSSLRDIRKLAGETGPAAGLVCGLLAAVTLLVWAARESRRAFAAFREGRGKREGWIRAGAGVGLVFLAALCVLLVRFPLYIPPSELPADNIFDFGFYLGNILERCQLKNRVAMYDFYWNLSWIVLPLSAATAAGAAGFFACAWFYGLRLTRPWRRRLEGGERE